VQAHQGGLQGQTSVFIHQTNIADLHAIAKVSKQRVDFRQASQGLFPFGHIAPAFGAQLLGNEFGQVLAPLAEFGLFEPREQGAIIE